MIHAKIVSISCTQMKLFLFECLASLHCRYRQFYRFLRKIVEIVLIIKPQMGTRIHGITSSEPLTTFLRRTMRSRQDVVFNFGLFCPNLIAMTTPLASLKFWVAYSKSPAPKTQNAKFVLISCAEVKLCVFECMPYLYHCRYRQVSPFLRKIVEIVNNF